METELLIKGAINDMNHASNGDIEMGIFKLNMAQAQALIAIAQELKRANDDTEDWRLYQINT